MDEQEKTEKLNGFRSAAEGLVHLFETHADGLRQMSDVLEDRKRVLDARERDLDSREVRVAHREAAVGNVRLIAAERKAQLEVAQDAVAKADKMRRNAEAEMRSAQRVKQDLEVVLAKLLQEKSELAAQLAAVPQLQFIKDHAAPVADAVKEGA